MKRQVSTCRQKLHQSCHPVTLSTVLGPNKDQGREEPDEEWKHSLSRRQTWQLGGLVDKVQAEQKKQDEAEEWRFRRQLNLLQELRRLKLTNFQELSRNGERRTKHSIGDREPSVLLGNSTEAKENQRDV